MTKSNTYSIHNITCQITNFTVLPKQQLLDVLRLRNDDRIRFFMNNTELISESDHFNFVNDLKERNDKSYFLVSEKDIGSIGVVYFDKIINNTAYLGIYSNPDSPVKKKGTILMNVLFSTAYHGLSIRTLYLEVRESNNAAIGLYQKFHFNKVEISNGFIVMKKDLTPDMFGK